MNDEASSSSARMQPTRPTAVDDFQVTNTSAESGKIRRPSVISGFRDRLRSRLSSSSVGNRLKSLIRWRELKQRVSSSKRPTNPTTTTTTSASSFEDISLAASAAVDSTLESAISEAGNRLTTTTLLPSASRIEEEDNPGAPPSPSPCNLIECNLISSSFDTATTSSFVSARSSMPSHQGDDREVTSSTYPQASNSTFNASDSSNRTENTDDEVNPINGQDPLGLPSAVIGVQLQTTTAATTSSSMGATRILDVIPILFIQSGGSLSLGDSRSTSTAESFASTSTGSSSGGSGGVGVGTTTEDSSNESSSSSASAVIEIVTPMDESARRFERDYVRPYYDLSFRPTVRKHFRRLDDDPPIY